MPFMIQLDYNLDLFFWRWRRNSLALGINTMPADIQAPKVPRAGMVLAV